VTINTSAFQYKKPALKERTQEKYLPVYWQRCRMDQKKITPSREDRLSQLTTTQIDRIIDMEKIRGLLYDKKRRIRDTYFEYDQADPNAHSNVYQANFLAKINDIAIRRNVHAEVSGFDEFKGKEQGRMSEKEKSALNVPHKYTKEYATDHRRTERVGVPTEEDEVKSIESIQADLDAFEEALSDKRKSRAFEGRRSERKEYKLLPSNRWFYGMSHHYVEGKGTRSLARTEEYFRGSFDIEAESKQVRSIPRAFKRTCRSSHNSSQTNR
jgi:hypothetical protein